MKIAMISWEHPPLFVGGLGIHCEALVRELLKLKDDVDFYMPVSSGNLDRVASLPHIRAVELSDPPDGYVERDNAAWEIACEFSLRLDQVFDPSGVDLIHAHDWMTAVAALNLAHRYALPLVFTVHSTEYDRAGRGRPHPSILNLEMETVERSDRVIAVSRYTKEILVRHLDADPDRVTVIHNGLNVERFRLLRTRDYEKPGEVLFLGRVTAQKGPDIFLESAKRLIKARKRDIAFTLAGEGDMLPRLKRRAKRWGISGRIRFPGRVVGPELLACYRRASVYALPALSEPFGLTVLEAMASGLATIITHNTGAGEIVQNVLKVEPCSVDQLADAIDMLWKDPAMRRAYGEAAASEAERYAWSEVARKVRALYRSVLSGKGGEV